MPELSLYGHITNSCLQRDHPGFDEDATVRLLSELVKELGEEARFLIPLHLAFVSVRVSR